MRDKRRGGCQTPASLRVQTNLLKQHGAPLKSNLALVVLIVASFWWGWLRRSFYLLAWAPAKAMMRYDYAETLKVQLVNLGWVRWNISPHALKVKPLKRWRRVWENNHTSLYKVSKLPPRLLPHFGFWTSVKSFTVVVAGEISRLMPWFQIRFNVSPAHWFRPKMSCYVDVASAPEFPTEAPVWPWRVFQSDEAELWRLSKQPKVWSPTQLWNLMNDDGGLCFHLAETMSLFLSVAPHKVAVLFSSDGANSSRVWPHRRLRYGDK